MEAAGIGYWESMEKRFCPYCLGQGKIEKMFRNTECKECEGGRKSMQRRKEICTFCRGRRVTPLSTLSRKHREVIDTRTLERRWYESSHLEYNHHKDAIERKVEWPSHLPKLDDVDPQWRARVR